jgi:hypothetical protein
VIFGGISAEKPADFLKSRPREADAQMSATVVLVGICGLDGKRDLTTWHGIL